MIPTIAIRNPYALFIIYIKIIRLLMEVEVVGTDAECALNYRWHYRHKDVQLCVQKDYEMENTVQFL